MDLRSTKSARARPRRAFQACVPCKQQKVRCELELLTSQDAGAVCRRCRRARLQCVFAPRPTRKGQKAQTTSWSRVTPDPILSPVGHRPVAGENVDGPTSLAPSPQHPSTPLGPTASKEYENLVTASKIRNVGDALNQLLEPRQNERSMTSDGVVTTRAVPTSTFCLDWTSYPPWQQGWITASESEYLLNQWVHAGSLFDLRTSRLSPGPYLSN